jgi:hypothetical protein
MKATEISENSCAVSFAMPAWMPNPSQGNMDRQFSDIMSTKINWCPAPAAYLTYYLSKAKKSELVAADQYLHCSIDETYTVSSLLSKNAFHDVPDAEKLADI